MKYCPTKFKHTKNYTNDASLQGVDLHHKYEPIPSPKGKHDTTGIMPRIFITTKTPYKVGDVLLGTMDEFLALFNTRSNLNIYTRLAASKNREKPEPVFIEMEQVEEVVGVIEDSLQPLDCSSTVYKGVTITFKPVVNGLIFNTTEEAEQAIDLALKLNIT